MIQLRIRNTSELYNPYDPSQTRISEGIYCYLKTLCAERKAKNHGRETLRVIADSPIDGNRFKTAVQDAARKERDELDRKLTEENRKAACGYIAGILLSVGGVVLSLALDQVLLAIISFLGTSAITYAVKIQTEETPDIKKQKKLLEPLCDFDLELMSADEYDRASEQ